MSLDFPPKGFSDITMEEEVVNVFFGMVTKLALGVELDAPIMEMVIGG